MDIVVITIVLFSTLITIVSGIWVAIALGGAISTGKRKCTHEVTESNSRK